MKFFSSIQTNVTNSQLIATRKTFCANITLSHALSYREERQNCRFY